MPTFFSDDSFWNQPLSPTCRPDPRSDDMLALLRERSGEGDRGFWLNLETWTIPVYEVDSTTPLRRVHEVETFRDGPCPFHHGSDFVNPVPIPDHAIPDPERDSHLAVVDRSRNLVWDMWGARTRDDGEWESFTGMTYALDGPGVFSPSQFSRARDGDSIHSHGPSRAAGVPAVGGLIMREELESGRIDHRLSFATCANALKQFVHPPACWTDGQREGGIPEGALVQLDPSLDVDSLGLTPSACTIARTLQVYGAVNVDNCGGKAIYGEGLYGDPERSWHGLLTEDALTGIALSHYRILEIGTTVNKGNRKRKR